MKKINGHIQADPMPEELQIFVSSSAKRSITRYIQPLRFSYRHEDGSKKWITIVDTPGFGDTQSAEVDVSNTLGIIRSVGKAKKVHPVFLFNKDNAGGRAETLKELIEFYSCMIKNMVEKTKNVNFFFSNYP